ncbi:unnamed protein product [Ixodes persulcatus]
MGASGGLVCQLEDGVAVGQVPVVLHAVLLEVFARKALRRAHLELHLPEAAGLHRHTHLPNQNAAVLHFLTRFRPVGGSLVLGPLDAPHHEAAILLLLPGPPLHHHQVHVAVEHHAAGQEQLLGVHLHLELLGRVRQAQQPAGEALLTESSRTAPPVDGDVHPSACVLLELLDLLLPPLLGGQLAGCIGLLSSHSLLPLGHLLPDVGLDLGRVLHLLGAQDAHQVGHAHCGKSTPLGLSASLPLEPTLGLWRGLQPQAYLFLLLLPGFPAVLAPQLLALLLGQVHRKQHGLHRGRCEASRQLTAFPSPLCDWRDLHLDRVLHEVGDALQQVFELDVAVDDTVDDAVRRCRFHLRSVLGTLPLPLDDERVPPFYVGDLSLFLREKARGPPPYDLLLGHHEGDLCGRGNARLLGSLGNLLLQLLQLGLPATMTEWLLILPLLVELEELLAPLRRLGTAKVDDALKRCSRARTSFRSPKPNAPDPVVVELLLGDVLDHLLLVDLELLPLLGSDPGEGGRTGGLLWTHLEGGRVVCQLHLLARQVHRAALGIQDENSHGGGGCTAGRRQRSHEARPATQLGLDLGRQLGDPVAAFAHAQGRHGCCAQPRPEEGHGAAQDGRGGCHGHGLRGTERRASRRATEQSLRTTHPESPLALLDHPLGVGHHLLDLHRGKRADGATHLDGRQLSGTGLARLRQGHALREPGLPLVRRIDTHLFLFHLLLHLEVLYGLEELLRQLGRLRVVQKGGQLVWKGPAYAQPSCTIGEAADGGRHQGWFVKPQELLDRPVDPRLELFHVLARQGHCVVLPVPTAIASSASLDRVKTTALPTHVAHRLEQPGRAN